MRPEYTKNYTLKLRFLHVRKHVIGQVYIGPLKFVQVLKFTVELLVELGTLHCRPCREDFSFLLFFFAIS